MLSITLEPGTLILEPGQLIPEPGLIIHIRGPVPHVSGSGTRISRPVPMLRGSVPFSSSLRPHVNTSSPNIRNAVPNVSSPGTYVSESIPNVSRPVPYVIAPSNDIIETSSSAIVMRPRIRETNFSPGETNPHLTAPSSGIFATKMLPGVSPAHEMDAPLLPRIPLKPAQDKAEAQIIEKEGGLIPDAVSTAGIHQIANSTARRLRDVFPGKSFQVFMIRRTLNFSIPID